MLRTDKATVNVGSAVQLGIVARRIRTGAEATLLDAFIENIAARVEVPERCRLTLFREPRLDTGYPDLVAVVWEPGVAEKWSLVRNDLALSDIRLLQLLFTSRGLNKGELDCIRPAWKESVERLHQAEMIQRHAGRWRTKSLRRLFAVREIVAIEAKVRPCARVLQQAWANTWFASRSYILIPERPSARFTAAARQSQLGVMTMSADESLCATAPRLGLPRSYASWLFNEWSWRSLLGDVSRDN